MEYTLHGFDASKFQGVIDWGKAAKGQDFVLLRAGFGRLASQEDPRFKANVKGAYDAGMRQIGVYWYSYAADAADAEREAAACIAVLEPCREKITLPVFFDQEYEPAILAAGKEARTAACQAFIRAVQKAGYRAGMYGSLDWLTNKIKPELLPEGTVIWCARYGSAQPGIGHSVWQYTNEGKIDGISGKVDLNRAGDGLIFRPRWEKTPEGWKYGGFANRWGWINGNWYWFDEKGIAVTGWRKVDGVWYYFLTQTDAEMTGMKECACMAVLEKEK